MNVTSGVVSTWRTWPASGGRRSGSVLPCLAALMLTALAGCGRLLEPVKILPDDAPVIVTERAKVKVAVEESPGVWVEFGYIDVEPGDAIIPDYDPNE